MSSLATRRAPRRDAGVERVLVVPEVRVELEQHAAKRAPLVVAGHRDRDPAVLRPVRDRRRQCGTPPGERTWRNGCPRRSSSCPYAECSTTCCAARLSDAPTIGHSRNMPRPVRSRCSSASNSANVAWAPPRASAMPDGGSGPRSGNPGRPRDPRLRLDGRCVREPFPPRTVDAVAGRAHARSRAGCARAGRPGRDRVGRARGG